MSAALQLPMLWGAGNTQRKWQEDEETRKAVARQEAKPQAKAPEAVPAASVAFYRNHTEKMLRRYLYASMQVGRSPSVLGEPVARGWASSRPVKTFEDAVIFVLDIENCLNQLGSLDRQLICRIAIQEYTQSETAVLLGMSVRAVCYRTPLAIDRLTEKLLESGLLVLPG
jgi:DNA-directed RNA polymerase specialized sigma24 family protein